MFLEAMAAVVKPESRLPLPAAPRRTAENLLA
jgi:hypothetical protein